MIMIRLSHLDRQRLASWVLEGQPCRGQGRASSVSYRLLYDQLLGRVMHSA